MRTEHPNGGPGRTQPRHLDAAQKRQKAVRLRRDGHSYREIARALQTGVSVVHGYIKAEMDELRAEPKEEATQLREIEIAKLDHLEKGLRKRLRGADDQDAAKISAVVVKITESRRKLLGLDAPQKVEMRGNLYTVQEASPDCAEWGAPATQTAKGGESAGP